MGNCSDFLPWLGTDVSMQILTKLDDPADLVRASAVSRSWREFDVMELNNGTDEVGSNSSLEWGSLKRDYRVYALLAHSFTSFRRKDCILEAISASSTDNYPEESIDNTLEPDDRTEERASYWSSEGEGNPAVPETLTYRLVSGLCVITEISIQPFQAFFQFGCPIYSAKAVRFRMGYLMEPLESGSDRMDEPSASHRYIEDNFISTYVSPEFPMAQENSLQKFKLPEPVLCIGGVLQVELLGRVQRQEMDGLFYICVSHVKVVGRPLSPTFEVTFLDRPGKTGNCILKYNPNVERSMSPARSSEVESSLPSRLRVFRLMQRGVRGWEQMIINALVGNVAFDGDYGSDDELGIVADDGDYESDEELVE
ncbi:F-box protein At4g00755-like isoform X2 [Macadamia integrifolia]|uniref:F-box protein At4g00755-like isoform X2 n=1 Tax=Macadamia integrifolia TaxID=60698 RepID=UPI001C4F2AFB|nr:F-box protein At4g00755-like isoform X2 [Macadamia integrifolia]